MTAEKCAQPLIWSGKVIERINKFSQIIVFAVKQIIRKNAFSRRNNKNNNKSCATHSAEYQSL